MGAPAVDPDRLWTDLMALGALTESDRPYTRRAFSLLFSEGRALLAQRLAAAGLSVRTDAAGNLIGRLEGQDPAAQAIALGSHSDTVPSGGRFDGIAGVVAAVEVARAVAESSAKLRHPLEVIDCLAEEPTDFGLSCIGSRGIAGALDESMLEMRSPDGRRLAEVLSLVGGDPGNIRRAVRSDLRAFLELHIEQGPVLETTGTAIGVVTSIVGIRRLELAFQGEAAHAGTAPMDLRRDAAVAAAACLVEARRKADALAAPGRPYFVATVGILQIEPGGSNVVPGRARMVIDVRSSDPASADQFTEHMDRFSLVQAQAARVERTEFTTLSDSPPTTCDPTLRGMLAASATRLNLSVRDIASGAGHDTAFMARVCPAAMVFIPCLRGMSHHPDEWADREACAAGAAVLLDAVQRLDKT
jgi:N-carbamoyl-L-amino-acid hydrolase